MVNTYGPRAAAPTRVVANVARSLAPARDTGTTLTDDLKRLDRATGHRAGS